MRYRFPFEQWHAFDSVRIKRCFALHQFEGGRLDDEGQDEASRPDSMLDWRVRWLLRRRRRIANAGQRVLVSKKSIWRARLFAEGEWKATGAYGLGATSEAGGLRRAGTAELWGKSA